MKTFSFSESTEERARENWQHLFIHLASSSSLKDHALVSSCKQISLVQKATVMWPQMLRNLKDACFYAMVVRGTRMFWMMWYIRKAAQSAYLNKIVVVVQSLSPVLHFVTPWTAAPQTSLSFTISQSFLKFLSIELVMPSNYLILCCPLLLLPSILPSIRVFSNELVLHIRWPKYCSLGLSTSVLPMNIQDWFPLGLTGLISLQSKGFSTVFSSPTVRRHRFFSSPFNAIPSSYFSTLTKLPFDTH